MGSSRVGPFSCEQCGDEFMGWSGNKNKFCCPECFNKYRSEKIERTCQICSKKFETKPCQIKRGGGKYCSPECQYIAIGNQRRKEKKTCIRCGAPKPHQNKKYCSMDCYKQNLRTRDSILTKEEYKKVRDKILHKRHKKQLTDHYIKKTLAHYGVRKIPRSIIRAKRNHLKITRTIKTKSNEKYTRTKKRTS